MDTAHISVAKIVATPLDTSWAQAYSAGKLYIALSLQGEDSSLAVLGKDTIEKLQREFFALDEKSLAAVKKAVGEATQSIPDGVDMSLVVSTIVESVLYIIIVNAGNILLKRGESLSIIAAGEAGAITSFSGKCETHDIFLLTTSGFLKTVAMSDIESASKHTTSQEVGESLAPYIHDGASGTEAALVIRIDGEVKSETPATSDVISDTIQEEENNDHLQLEEEVPEKKSSRVPSMPHISFNLKRYVPQKITKMHVIIVSVIILILVLAGSMLFENTKRQSTEQNARIEKILTPNKIKYEEAIVVMSLNKSLATEGLTKIKNDLEKEQVSFPEGSDARKKLDNFLLSVTDALGGKTNSGKSPINIFLEGSKNDDITSVTHITAKGDILSAAGNSKIGIIDTDGSVSDSFEGVSSPLGISANEENIYVLSGSSVSKFIKSDGKKEIIIEDQDKPISIATFGDNVYVLSATDKTVYKYRPNAFAKEKYFVSDTTLKNPSSIAIDSSIYIIDDGKVRKFTRGSEDTFNYTGGSLSKGSLIYTDEDYSNIYIVDPIEKALIILDKSGGLVGNISLKGMKKITSVTANEEDKKAYIAADNNIYSVSY